MLRLASLMPLALVSTGNDAATETKSLSCSTEKIYIDSEIEDFRTIVVNCPGESAAARLECKSFTLETSKLNSTKLTYSISSIIKGQSIKLNIDRTNGAFTLISKGTLNEDGTPIKHPLTSTKFGTCAAVSVKF